MSTEPSREPEKRCRTCRQLKSVGEFYRNKNTRDGLQTDCKPCHKAFQARVYRDPVQGAKKRAQIYAWQKANPDKVKASRIRSQDRMRQKVHDAYGNKCACCSEDEPKFLNVDHVNGRAVHGHGKKTGMAIHRIVIAEGFPDCYQLLCWNCNMAKAHFGTCPHAV